jgi:hypothetical protein
MVNGQWSMVNARPDERRSHGVETAVGSRETANVKRESAMVNGQWSMVKPAALTTNNKP